MINALNLFSLFRRFLLIAVPIFLVINYNIYPLGGVFSRVFIVYSIVIIIFLTKIIEDKNKYCIKFLYCFFLALSLLVIIFSYYKLNEFMFYLGFGTPIYQLIIASIGILLLLEATRIVAGLVLPVMAILSILYAIYRGYNYQRIITEAFSYEGSFGIAVSIVLSVVFIFMLLGNMLQEANFGDFLLNFGNFMVGGTSGGPAKVAVLSSALFGSISGSAVANVAATGTFTIPLMKKLGFSSTIAGAIEASASTGGQFTPPIMAAAAFIMAELLRMPYLEIAKAAILPAIAFYVSIFISIDAYSKREGLKGIPKNERPTLRESFKSGGHLMLTLILIIYLLVIRVQPLRAAYFSILFLFPLSYLAKATRLTPKRIVQGLGSTTKNMLIILSCGAVIGIILSMIGLTGFSAKVAYFILGSAKYSKLVVLFLTMTTCIIFGMALPTTISYLILVSILGVTLIRIGVVPLSAHLFILYFAALSGITPPVAMAAYTGAAIAGANFIGTAIQACKISIVAFIVPYIFVYVPSMILQGDSPGILFIIFLYIIVIPFSLSSAFWGYSIIHKITFLERILHFGIAIAILYLMVRQLFFLQIVLGLIWVIFVVIECVFRTKAI